MKRVVLFLDDDFHKQLKLHCVEIDQPIMKFVVNLIKEELENTKKDIQTLR